MVASGKGEQVLFVEEDGRYRCDEDALQRVVSAARGLPVAVVSVAGATRGGKSFLLDFFLRYLRAPEAARRSGAWLGADDEPLTGFSWRGGCERHTEGILVWSEPIIVTLGPNKKNEKVAVVLLDTQGSFDSSSTMRDSSTVFALSTLLSSVQIYNLSQNIKENDLHYLQLFTEYGKLAREEGAEKPFQELRFLVRDWCFAYDHPVGAEGGQQLLDKRLEIRPDQARELREIRAHVRGAFERVRGFLLPHPGLTVAASPAFTGCLKDISSEFKDALLELVPSLFDPENLTIKHINGQKVTLQDFTEYFKAYVEIFNSDTLPKPTTVMQATSTASLEAALNACRDVYGAHMAWQCAGGATCMPRGELPQHHAAALLAARQDFAARRTLAAPALAAARLDALLEELDASLSDYVAINSALILEAAARCKAGYEAAMQTDECLAPDELTARHNTAVASARKAFHAEFNARPKENPRKDKDEYLEKSEKCEGNSEEGEGNSEEGEGTGEEGEGTSEEGEGISEECNGNSNEDKDDNKDWKILKKELEELLPLHRERNAARIAAAQVSARDMYTKRLHKAINSAPCLHPRSLSTVHFAAVMAAKKHMLRAWHDEKTVPEEHKKDLCTYLEEKYQEFVATNDTDNQNAVKESVNIYKEIMSEIFLGAGGRCLHPQDLKAEHGRAQEAAAAHFLERRDAESRHFPVDNHMRNVHKGVIPLYLKFEEGNILLNKEAVTAAHEYYLCHISPVRVGADATIDLMGPPDMAVYSRHPRIKSDAIEQFLMKRRSSGIIYSQDTYLEDLDTKIEKTYSWIKLKVAANIAANVATTVAGAAAMGAMVFMGRRA